MCRFCTKALPEANVSMQKKNSPRPQPAMMRTNTFPSCLLPSLLKLTSIKGTNTVKVIHLQLKP